MIFASCLQVSASAVPTGLLLPDGYLSTHGNQIVDSRGRPVRIASVGGLGTVVTTGGLTYNFGCYDGLGTNIAAMARLGFNCIRVDFNDKNVQDPATLTQFDQLVAACKDHGLKVIFDHHNNEATPAIGEMPLSKLTGFGTILGRERTVPTASATKAP